jgi:hypothetical protein
MKILAGADKSFEGRVSLSPGIRIGFLEQEPELGDGATVQVGAARGLCPPPPPPPQPPANTTTSHHQHQHQRPPPPHHHPPPITDTRTTHHLPTQENIEPAVKHVRDMVAQFEAISMQVMGWVVMRHGRSDCRGRPVC